MAEKDYVNKFVEINSQDYIDEYVEIVQRKDFSFSSIYILNLKYLQKLYAIHRKESLNEAKYAFYQEGPTWVITFNGTTIRGLRGKGFDYLHYLVSNKNTSYNPEELNQIDGYSQEQTEKFNSESDLILTDKKYKYSNSNGSGIHHMDMLYGKSENELKKEYYRLRKNKDDAERSNDPILIQQAKENYDNFMEFFSEYASKGGRKKKFEKKEHKNLKNKVAINLKRALERIRKENPTIWKHFDESLSSPYSNDLYYRPPEDLEWKC